MTASDLVGAPPEPVIGVIGGSGLYDIEGLSERRWQNVSSPFGEPSDDILVGRLEGTRIAFLPRHGRGHRLSPTDINYRANIDGLKRVGVTDVVSLSAVGSLRENLSPGTFVLVDQFIDGTFARPKSFFGAGLVAHVSMAHPVCESLVRVVAGAAEATGIEFVTGGTYLAMEGPQFSSRAESELYRSWNCDVIGMTNMPEAKLAREAALHYVTVAMVTDYDCWHPGHDAVDVATIIEVLRDNASKGKELVRSIAGRIGERAGPCATGCATSLRNAIITAPEAIDPVMRENLRAILGPALGDRCE
jgi:5'-methylthioadenosine phosphorylase